LIQGGHFQQLFVGFLQNHIKRHFDIVSIRFDFNLSAGWLLPNGSR
jgi:hypothetical protein